MENDGNEKVKWQVLVLEKLCNICFALKTYQ